MAASLTFYMQMQIEKKYKAFAYRNYRQFTQQCIQPEKEIKHSTFDLH